MNEKIEIKQKYDDIAEAIDQAAGRISELYTAISPVMRYFRQRKVETAMQLGNFKKGDRILEIGSNMGQYTTLLAEKGCSMVGIDLSDRAVAVAKKAAEKLKLSGLEYFPMDAENMPSLKDETFDGVVSFSTLRYVPNLRNALKEIFRVTKKGASVVLDFPNKHCPWFTLLKNKFGVDNHIYDHFYSAADLKKLFAEAGFMDIKTRKIMFTHYTFDPKFLRLYKAIDRICERTLFLKETAAIIFCKGTKG